MSKLKRAILVAAGEGKRLRPVTLETPKPLVKVNGKRIMDTSIEALRMNGIQDIYIVVGYKKELFYEAYKEDKDIHIIENPYYLQGNNITSLYMVREFLPESFVVEADIYVKNPDVYHTSIEKSGYLATWMEEVPEWQLILQNDRIVSCDQNGGEQGYRLWGISMWNKEDGEKLSEEIRYEFEEKKNWETYWDLIALDKSIDKYDLGVRQISDNELCEIDTVQELVEMDHSYANYLNGGN